MYLCIYLSNMRVVRVGHFLQFDRNYRWGDSSSFFGQNMASEAISECLILKNFPGRACPQTPLASSHIMRTQWPYQSKIAGAGPAIWLECTCCTTFDNFDYTTACKDCILKKKLGPNLLILASHQISAHDASSRYSSPKKKNKNRQTRCQEDHHSLYTPL